MESEKVDSVAAKVDSAADSAVMDLVEVEMDSGEAAMVQLAP